MLPAPEMSPLGRGYCGTCYRFCYEFKRRIAGMTRKRRLLIPVLLAACVAVLTPLTALATAATDPLLGTSGNYAVLASATITNTGPTWITGQMALSPGTS